MKRKIAILGSRFYPDPLQVSNMVGFLGDVIIVSGTATGVESVAIRAAKYMGKETIVHRPPWEKHPGIAQFIKDSKVIDECDKLIAFWDGESKEPLGAIEMAKRKGKPYIILRPCEGHDIPDDQIDFSQW